MNKYFNRALFFSEKKNMIGAIIAYSLIYISSLFNMIPGIIITMKDRTYAPPNPLNWLHSCYPILVAIALMSVLSSYNEKDKKYYFMLTQPYSRDSMIITKTICFILPYLITTVIYGITTLIIIVINKSLYQFDYFGSNIGTLYQKITVGLTLKVLSIIAVLTFVALFTQLMQMIFGKMIAGVILPIAIYIMMMFSFNVGVNFISEKLRTVRTAFEYGTKFLFSFNVSLENTLISKSLPSIIVSYLWNPNILGSLLVLIISAFLLWLTLLLNRKIKSENISDMFIFKGSKKAFRAVCTLAITILASLIILSIGLLLYEYMYGEHYITFINRAYGIERAEAIEQNIYLALNILWIPAFVIIYRFSGKIADKRRAA